MQKRKSIKFKPSDYIIIVITISLALAALYFFFQELNKRQQRNDSLPIATISYKKNSAQRKFEDRVLWDRLRQNSSVYNGDIIRTDPESEAIVSFVDGNNLSLIENTMVQIFFNEDGASASVTSGTGGVSVDTEGASGGFSLLSENGARVDVEKGTSFSVKNKDGAMDVSVQSGFAKIVDKDGKSFTAENGSAYALEKDGKSFELPFRMIFPKQDFVVLKKSGKTVPVKFEWKFSSSDEAKKCDNVLIETAKDKNFISITNTFSASYNESASISLPEGITFWRAIPHAGNEKVEELESVSGKITVLDASAPEIVSPENKSSFSYRKEKPLVKFMWKNSSAATYYIFRLANNQEMQNPLLEKKVFSSSFATNELDDGNWFCTVTPFYAINNVGFTECSPVTEFSITKSSTLLPPVLVIPTDDAEIVRQKEDTQSNIYFSWHNENEVVRYTLSLCKDKDFVKDVKSFEVVDNFYKLNLAEESLSNGKWFWRVSGTDIENISSTDSPSKSFTLLPYAPPENKLIFPNDEYSVSLEELPNIQFAWKLSDEDDMSILEISKTKDFTKLEVKQVLPKTVFSGVSLTPGTYYWRVKDSKNISSKIKSFIVKEPPKIPSKVVLLYPENKAQFNFEKIARSPLVLKWRNDDKILNADFTLEKISEKGRFEKILERKNPSNEISLERLTPGLYSWSIRATAFDGTDISCKEPNVFTVKNANKLPAAKLLSPLKAQILRNEYFKEKKYIVFEWEKIPYATKYVFNLYRSNEKDKILLTKVLGSKENSFILDDLSILGNGNFVWTINSESRAEDGFLIQEGTLSRSSFSIDILKPGKVKVKNLGEQYGE